MAFPARRRTRWLTAAAARLTFLSGVGYVAAAYTVSRFLTRPRRGPVEAPPSDLGLACQPIEMVAEDGIALSGWMVEPPEPRGTVALFHGMRQNRAQMSSRIAFLTSAGYRCVAIDHRAHGESGGKRISFGWYEARDVRAVAHWLDRNHPETPRFALGISMGAAAICFAGSDCGWAGAILEGIYADLRTAFKRRIGALYPTWFGELYPGAMWITQKRLRLRVSNIRPVDAARHWRGIPTLGLTGSLDQLAPVIDTTQVLSAMPGSAECEIITGAGHSNLFEVGGEFYRQRILRFLQAS